MGNVFKNCTVHAAFQVLGALTGPKGLPISRQSHVSWGLCAHDTSQHSACAQPHSLMLLDGFSTLVQDLNHHLPALWDSPYGSFDNFTNSSQDILH